MRSMVRTITHDLLEHRARCPLTTYLAASHPVESFDIGGTDNMVLAAGAKARALNHST